MTGAITTIVTNRKKGDTLVKTSIRKNASRAGLVVLAGAMASLMASTAAWAGTSAGLALIVNPSTGQNQNSGGSSTPFTIKLPPNAACPKATNVPGGDKVQSYIVLASSHPDPGAVQYNNGPVPSSPSDPAYPLVSGGTTQYSDAATAPTTGVIVNIPTFDFTQYTITGTGGTTFALPAGVYNIGIACTLPPPAANQPALVDVYWNTQIQFSPSTTDPNGETWTTVPNPQVPEFPLSVVLPLSAAAVIGGGFVVTRRRRRRQPQVMAV